MIDTFTPGADLYLPRLKQQAPAEFSMLVKAKKAPRGALWLASWLAIEGLIAATGAAANPSAHQRATQTAARPTVHHPATAHAEVRRADGKAVEVERGAGKLSDEGRASATSPASHAAPASAVVIPARTAQKATTATIPTPQAFCQEMVTRLPSIARSACVGAEFRAADGRSVQGRPLYQRDVISPNARLRVLVIGGIHGDELSSTALVMNWVNAAKETPSNIHWRFVPLINPDGMLLSKPTRTNANGVDLNRNFPTPNWEKEAAVYWNQRTKNDPRRYPGPKPLSEPESRWLHDEMEHWKPNLIVSVHAPYGILDFDGPTVAPQRLGRLYLDQVGIFPGSLGNYGGVHKKVPVVTIELPSALRTPQEAEIRQMWLDLLRWTAERLGAG